MKKQFLEMYSNDDDSVSTMSSTVASPYKPPYYS